MVSAEDENRTFASPEELRARLDYDDARLLGECRVHTFRARGPGGQKRNKTSSAVRLHHTPSGWSTKAAESRSQHVNKARALRRLREAIAVRARCPLPSRMVWPGNVRIVDGTLAMAPSNPSAHRVIALLLDALYACQGRVADAAAYLRISPSSLTRVLSQHPVAWTEANRIRQEAGLPTLRA